MQSKSMGWAGMALMGSKVDNCLPQGEERGGKKAKLNHSVFTSNNCFLFTAANYVVGLAHVQQQMTGSTSCLSQFVLACLEVHK